MGADRVVVVGRWPAGCARQPARPDGASPRSAPGSCCAASSPGRYPRGGSVHLRLWLAERLADARRRGQPRRRPLDHVLRPRARRQGRPRRRPAHACRRSPAAHARRGLLGRARGRPAPATGSTATCCTSAASASAPSAAVGARSTLVPGRGVGPGRRGRARLGGLRRGAAGRVLVRLARRPRIGAPRTRGRTSARRTAPRWIAAYGAAVGDHVAAAGRGRRRRRCSSVGARGRGTHDRSATRRARRSPRSRW